MRKKKQITLRIEWIETIATLITSLQLDVMNAVIAYLVNVKIATTYTPAI